MNEARLRLSLKQHGPTVLAERYRQEIEQAIAQAKDSGRQKRAIKKWSQTEVSRFHYRNEERHLASELLPPTEEQHAPKPQDSESGWLRCRHGQRCGSHKRVVVAKIHANQGQVGSIHGVIEVGIAGRPTGSSAEVKPNCGQILSVHIPVDI